MCRYESLIYSAARDAGLATSDAADVTQTAFVTLLESLDSLRNDDRLASWLMTVAQRQIWRTRRRLERDVAVHRAAASTDLSGGRRSAGTSHEHNADSLAEWERTSILMGGLQQLGSPCRELLYLLYLDHRQPTYSVVAARLGRSIGSIGPMRGRCLEKLRSILGED